MRFALVLILTFLLGCNKPKTVLICGDHVCVNKAEAKQYFEENLSIEVKVIKKKSKKNKIDLVQLNLDENINKKRRVTIKEKIETNQNIKELSKSEKREIKSKIKIKNKELNKKTDKKLFVRTPDKKNKDLGKNKLDKKIDINNINNKKGAVIDVCSILEKCEISEITKYLIKQGQNKKYPDITLRE